MRRKQDETNGMIKIKTWVHSKIRKEEGQV